MNVLIRCDGSQIIGAGHVMRMLALALTLREQGACVSFLMRPLSETLLQRIQEAGFLVHWVQDLMDRFEISPEAELAALSQHAGCLIVDHYGYDANLLKQCGQYYQALALVDDFQPERVIPELDLVVNPNVSAAQLSYPEHLGQEQLLGAQYALLRPEFWPENHAVYRFRPACKRLLACFGGSDTAGMTQEVLQLLSKINFPLELTVITGFDNPHESRIREILDAMPHAYTLLSSVQDMAGKLLQQDVAILPASTMALEAMALGVPTAIIISEDNQRPGGLAMVSAKATVLLGDTAQWDSDQAFEKINSLIHNAASREAIAKAGSKLVNPKGACQVANTILTLTQKVSLSS